MTYKYMVFDQNTNITINYKDLDESENKLANAVFSTNNTWKDNFGQSYFQPENNITR
ncbi:MAG: hypothetical protein P1U46_03020 [Patescibacteria group bacterium]|nr:hypothetical protein [Patescibacteria group bacterium]